MELTLSPEQAKELHELLDDTMSELSHEIAATDNADFRARLRERRDLLATIRGQLDAS